MTDPQHDFTYRTLAGLFVEAHAFADALKVKLDTHAQYTPRQTMLQIASRDAETAVKTVKELREGFETSFKTSGKSDADIASCDANLCLGAAFARLERLLTPAAEVLPPASLKSLYEESVHRDLPAAERRAFIRSKLLSKFDRLIP